MRGRRIFFYYLPALIWTGFIFYLSSLPNLRYQTGNISSEIFLRKAAHFLEYVLLAWLWARIFWKDDQQDEWRIFWGVLGGISLFAFSDEWHQSYVVGRSGRWLDAFYDIVSGLIFLQSWLWWRKKIVRRFWPLFLYLALLIFLEIQMIKEAKEYQEKILLKNVFSKTEKLETEQLKENLSILSTTNLMENSEKIEQENFLEKTPPVLPEQVFLKVPFTSQAPLGVWDKYHQEACEEASLLMLAYFKEKKEFKKELAEKELQKIIAFQVEKYGDYKDSNMEQLKKLGEDYWGWKNLRVIYDFSLVDLKYQLAQGRPVIVPCAGQKLGNPNFTSPGPLYHNLILSGYEKGVIITNDPGTKRGESYRYKEDLLFEAIHDFTGDKKLIESGRKAMLILEN